MSGSQSAPDGLVFPAGHEQTKLKIFLVIFIVGIIGLGWGDDQGVRELESLGYPALIGSITSGQTLHFNNQDTIIDAGLHIPEKLLHLRPGVNGFSRDHFCIDLDHV